MSDNPEFPELFDIDRFLPDGDFEQILDRFENGRTPDKLPKNKNKVLSVEEFTQETKPTKREELIKRLEALEKQIEEQHTN